MIRINTLYTLEEIRDCYYILDDLTIININTGCKKKITVGKRGYPYVTLECNNSNKNKKVLMHKIVALAFIKNAPYELIEHIDDNKLDYSVENLKFSDRKNNTKTAKKLGAYDKVEQLYIVCKNEEEIEGTMKGLSIELGIPKATLYDIFYNNRKSRKYNIQKIKISNRSTDCRKVTGA